MKRPKLQLAASTGITIFLIATLVVLAQPPGGEQPERKSARENGELKIAPRMQPGPWGAFAPPQLPLMTALDTNGDGRLSAEEMAGASEALKKLDANQDGELGQRELAPQFPGRGMGPGPAGPGPSGRRPAGRGPFAPGPGAPGHGAPGPGAPGFGPGGPGFGSAGPGPVAGPGRGRGTAAASAADMFQASTQPRDDAERAILQALEDIQREQGRRMNVPVADARLLRLLAEAIGAKTVVEFGTSNGVSAIWMALALRKTDGRLISHELDPNTAALARQNFARAGVADIVTVVEGDGHETAKKLTGPIDLVFIDADKEGYLDYLEKTLPLLRPGGLVLAHNMTLRQASPDFVKAITANPDLETLFYMEGGGMSVSVKKR